MVEQGRSVEAVNLLLAALGETPDHAGLRWRVGELQLEAGFTEHAISHLKAALAAGTSPSSVLPVLAKALLVSGDTAELLAMDLPPALSPYAEAAVMALQAQAHAQREDFAAAERRLQEAALASPNSAAIGVARARILVAQGRQDRARLELQGLVEAFPDDADALGFLADLERHRGDLTQAEALYSRALENATFKVQVRFLRAEVRLDLGDSDGAADDTARLEAAVPETFAALYPRARLLLLAGDAEQALQAFEAANQLQPAHAATLLFGGIAAYSIGRTSHAEDWLARVLTLAPGNVQARLVMGAIRFNQGRYAEAERLLRPLPSVLPGNPLPRRLLAAALVAQDKAADAVPLLTALVDARPDDPRSQLDLSVALVLSGADTRGAMALGALVSAHPDYRPAYQYLIAYYVRTQDWTMALDWAERFSARYPDDAQPGFLRAEVLLAAGRRTAAQEALAEVLAMAPGHRRAHLKLAALALETGDASSAEAHYASVLEQAPDDLDALMGRAAMLAAQARPDEAVALLEQAIMAHPSALEPRMALARLWLAQGNPQPAVAALREGAEASFRRDAAYVRLLAEALLANESPQLAADAGRDLVTLLPKSLDAHGLYAQILTRLDDKAALQRTLEQMLSIDPTHEPALLELVRLHIATGLFEQAERLLGPVLADLDRPPLADFLFGLILTATDRATQAVAPLKHAYRTLPSERTLLALANAEAQSGRVEDAIGRTAEWLDAHPDDVEVRVTRAGHLVQAERVTEAIAEYERALALAPNHAVALNNLAWYALAQDPRRAMEYAQRALEVKPDSVEVAHTLVSAQVEAGEWRDAELTLDRVLPLHPTDTGLMWLSARVLHQKGRAEEALRRLERILNADPPDAERERARALLVQIEDEIRAEEAKKLW